MNVDAVKCQVFVLGGKTIQTTLLADLLRLNLRDRCVVLDDLTETEHLSRNRAKRLVLVDFSVIAEETLASFLERSTEQRKHLFVAVFNVKRDAPHDHILDWPEIRGIFYDDTTQEQLVKGVKAILRGEFWFGRDLVNRYLHRHRTGKKRLVGATQAPLTTKELEILNYVVTGHSNKEIANRLSISDRTVKTHVYNIFKKIQVKNRVQAANWVQNYNRHSDGEND